MSTSQRENVFYSFILIMILYIGLSNIEKLIILLLLRQEVHLYSPGGTKSFYVQNINKH